MSDSEGLVSEMAVVSVYNFRSKCICEEPVWESAHTHSDTQAQNHVYIFNKHSDEKAWVSGFLFVLVPLFADDVRHYCNIVTIAPVVSFF